MDIWDRNPRISRRQALGALCSLSGTGLLAGCGLSREPAVGTTAAFRNGEVIRTVLRDVAPDALGDGAVLMHEHLSIHYPLTVTEHFTDDVDLMTEEARAAARDGIALIVDGGHPDMARSLDALRRIATGSGLPIVASGGYYMQRSYPPELATKSASEIADELVAEAARDRLGAFGEIGQQGGELTPDERKVFEAVGIAQARTGLPVFTHSPYSGRRDAGVPRDAGLRQLDILERAGADPASVAIGHVCCLDDPNAEIAGEIARRGAFIGFDRVTLNAIMPDADRVVMVMALVEAGHADKLLLSSDFYSANSLKSRGGAGLAQTVTVFAPMLRDAGLSEATRRQILNDNPRRFLAFEPRA
jgi:phosphotriesterase-related protein